VTADLQHPAWCDPAQCSEDDRHYSRTLTVPAVRAGDPAFALRLYTTVFAPLGVDLPLAEFEVSLDDGPAQQSAAVDLDLLQIRQLHDVLGAALHVFEADQPHLTELPEPAPKGGATS